MMPLFPKRLGAALLLLSALVLPAACRRMDDIGGRDAEKGPSPESGEMSHASATRASEPMVREIAPGLEVMEAPPPAARPSQGLLLSFVDVSREAGVIHRHEKGTFDRKLQNIMPWIASIGAAAAVSDYDGDGNVDLYVTSSRPGSPNALFRNEGSMRFTETARAAGVAEVNDASGVSMDAAFADLDNDGFDDLYIVKWGRNQLFRNRGDGTFTDITAEAGAGDGGNGNCVLPFDHDNDGLLDLYICNYFPSVNLQDLETTRIMHDSFEAARNGGRNVLYHNLGGMRFEDVAPRLQLDDSGWSLDAGISDIDNDGDVDLFVANDFGQDKVYLNNGDGTFTDFTLRAIGHETFKGMNIDFGDFNNDGFTDGYVANITTREYLREGNQLWLNAGDSTFSNVAATTGTFDGGWGWGARFFDYDHDGDLDILAVNGFVSAGPASYWEDLANIAVNPAFRPEDSRQWPEMGDRSLSGYEATRLFRNNGDGSFEEVAAKAGIADRRDGRGIALADFDGDGDLDVYIANQNALGALYRNDIGNAQRWIAISLVGTRSNRNAIGARLQASARLPGGRLLELTREVNGANSFSSQSSYRAHFGLGQAEAVDKLTVFWPSGVVQEFEGLAADRHYRITERGEPLAVEARKRLFFAAARERGETPAEVAGREGAAPRAAILDLEEKIRRRPRHPELANRYRFECVESRYYDRSIEFFRSLIRERGPLPALRLQLALAFVDKIPSLTGDVMGQGSLAKESLNELALVEEQFPRSYAVHYITGMNHLYWPANLKHFDDAVRCFESCLEIQAERAAAGRGLEPHHAEVYAGLGDAHVKGKRFGEARRAWTAGLAHFPGDERLRECLALDDAALAERIHKERGLAERIDTRLAMLREENGLAEAEARLERRPGDRATLNEYRLEAYELEATGRALDFLSRLSAAHPRVPEIRLHIALAHADRISEIGRLGEEVQRLAERVLADLADYIRDAPADWVGPYLLGTVHLYRPPSRESAAAAVEALERALQLARRPDGSLRIPYPSLALGDAWVVAGEAEKAQEIWLEAAAAFPHIQSWRARLDCPAASLRSLVRAEYDVVRGVKTDLEQLADREGELEALEKALRAAPARRDADRYRALVRKGDDPERALRFFEALLAERPRSADLRLQLALALVDRTPDRDLGSVRKGLLSSKALELIEELIEVHPGNWGLHYLRGSIHLHWFTKLKHVPYAIESFHRALEIIKEAREEEGGRGRADPRVALVYQAMGDAHVKQNEFVVGRTRYWKVGQELFPGDRGLRERMDLTSLMVNDFVEARRSWEAPQDTALLSEIIGDLAEFPEKPAG
jgi:tetratricopeptide (TPR) repeat protein